MSWSVKVLKILIAFLNFLTRRKCENCFNVVVSLFFVILFGLYVATSYYPLTGDKLQPLPEGNESGELRKRAESFIARKGLSHARSDGSCGPEGCQQFYVNLPMQDSNLGIIDSTAVLEAEIITERPHLVNESVAISQAIQVGEISLNCGLPQPCNSGEFSVHLYTGRDHKDEPRLCIDSKYILSKKINNGGRGINVVIVDNMTRTVIRVTHFDTYDKESTPLETMLLTLRPGDIAFLLTFDEPSRKLSRVARLLLYELGSALIQNLSYRGSWYLITQKGINGFSPFEELNLVENSGWPKHHDVRLCIPFHIKAQVVHPDPEPASNPSRVNFCQAHDNFPIFCDVDVVNDPLIPAPVWKQSAAVNKIYTLPILIMSSENIHFLPLTLETLIRQPGIKPSMVVVYHLPKYMDVQSLSELFGFMSEELMQTSSYCERIGEAFDIARLLFPDAKEMLFLGENAVLAPDFLFYMGQLLTVLSTDASVLSVSAWNENGYSGLSGDPSLLYRVETFSSLGILVRRNFFQKSWCRNISVSDPLYISKEVKGENIIPDVSRVALAGPLSGLESDDQVSYGIFTHGRTVTYEQNIALKNLERIFHEEYEKDLEVMLSLAVPLTLDANSVTQCLENKSAFQENLLEDLHLLLSNTSSLHNRVIAAYYYQQNEKDMSTLQYLCQCFGMYYHPLYPGRGTYKGLLRFMLKDNHAILVGSSSPFFRLKPKHIPVIRVDHPLGSMLTELEQ